LVAQYVASELSLWAYWKLQQTNLVLAEKNLNPLDKKKISHAVKQKYVQKNRELQYVQLTLQEVSEAPAHSQ
jgi:hypothetical protein